MPAYLVEAGRNAAVNRVGDCDAMVVFAADASTARKMCQARFSGDADAVWGAATVTEVVAAANWNGWVFRAEMYNASGTLVRAVSLTSTGAGQQTIDQVAAAFVTAFTTTGFTPSYNSTTNVLTLTAAGDNKGDHRLVFTIKPPDAQNAGDVNISDLVGTITHQGSAGAAVTVALPADNAVIPLVLRPVRSI